MANHVGHSERRYVERFWRVPVVAVIVAGLALLASYAFGTSYQATTTLLIRAGNTTFLSTPGGTLGAQGATINPSVSKSIADTESALLGNNTVASEVVDQLHLTKAATQASFFGHVKGALKDTYDYVVHGSNQTLKPHAQAVQNVQNGLAADELSDSYLLALTAIGSTHAQAVAIDNAAANDLVALIQKQSHTASSQNRQYLGAELNQASLAEQTAAKNLSNFATLNGISNATISGLFSAATRTDLQEQLAQTQAQLKGASAQVQSDQQALAATSPTSSSTQAVQTGRSTTQINQTGQNPNYQELQLDVKQDQADVASLSATISELTAELSPTQGAGAGSLSTAQTTQLAALEQSYTTSVDSYEQVQANYENSVVSTATDPIQLSRVDHAVAGSWPISPKRYLFLGIGLLLGLLGGFLLSARAAHRKNETLFNTEWDEALSQTVASPVEHWISPPGHDRRRNPDRVVQPISSTNGDGRHRVQVGAFEVFSQSGSGPTPTAADKNHQNGAPDSAS
jgi:uncharacterized protein involved in exopolysaccharide biosynthesis